jgi:hypothetical protein
MRGIPGRWTWQGLASLIPIAASKTNFTPKPSSMKAQITEMIVWLWPSIPNVFFVPTNTASFFPRVTAVYRRFRRRWELNPA